MGAVASLDTSGNALKSDQTHATSGSDDDASHRSEGVAVGIKRDTKYCNCTLDCESQERKRQRLHSAQLLGNILSGEGFSEAGDSEVSTELSEDFVSLPSTPARSRCRSGSSVKRGSDPTIGLANQCAEIRQDFVGRCRREEWPVSDVSAGSAKLRDGKYLYVIMVADRDTVRLLHEDDMDELISDGLTVGHTSLVDAAEFKRDWGRSWDEAEPMRFRRTVLYAGELMYEMGEGVVWWNNQSGHYLPPADGHTRVGFDSHAFAGFLG